MSHTAAGTGLNGNGQQERLGVGSKLHRGLQTPARCGSLRLWLCWGCPVFLVPLEHPQPCPASPAVPQVLRTGEMWLLLAALCLAQGLEDAIPGAEEIRNPERFMNIVSAGRATTPCRTRVWCAQSPPQGTSSAHPAPDSFTWPHLGGLGHQKSPMSALVSLTSCPQLELGLSLLFL